LRADRATGTTMRATTRSHTGGDQQRAQRQTEQRRQIADRPMITAIATCTTVTDGTAMISSAAARPRRSCRPRTPAESSAAKAVPSYERAANAESGSSEATPGRSRSPSTPAEELPPQQHQRGQHRQQDQLPRLPESRIQ
jgi:hypothetical protein